MANFPLLVVLSAAMGLSIFLSLPVVMKKAMGSRTILFLNAAAIGILIFLVGDVFSDAASVIYPGGSYVGDGPSSLLFLVGLVGSFLALFYLERVSPRNLRAPDAHAKPATLAVIIALAIGFQNLTEGLVFGTTWQAGGIIAGSLTVIFVGFFLQNVTEGFPIAAPFIGEKRPALRALTGYFLIGGVPTIAGGIVGYFWQSNSFDVFVDAIAIGAILYAVLPMLRICFRPAPPPEDTWSRINLVYLGILVGFAVGFGANAI